MSSIIVMDFGLFLKPKKTLKARQQSPIIGRAKKSQSLDWLTKLQPTNLQAVVHFELNRMSCHVKVFDICRLKVNIRIDKVITEYTTSG